MGPVITRARLGVCFGTACISLACGGASMDAGGAGGSSATGGAASGGSDSTGGAASGGSNSAGGAASGGSNSTGGAASGGSNSTGGTGGSSSGVDWDEVRCWQYQDTDARSCYGRIGNLWTPVELACAIEGEPRRPMDLSTNECDTEDISTPWDETWCHEEECYGRLGDWAARLRAACEIPDATPSGATPSETFCEGVVEAPVGWRDVQCVAANGAVMDHCYGFIGMYFPNFGLFPTCYVEAEMAADPDFTEVTPDAGGC
jgi:hypothetical protein